MPPWIETGRDCNRNVAASVQRECKGMKICPFKFDYRRLMLEKSKNISFYKPMSDLECEN